ncbi:MAG: 2,3-bisphosphoglycerate-independent phosphoglycerate mutase [Planctomycetota bacterium]
MDRFDIFRGIKRDKGGKMLLLVLDGLGGLPREPGGKTELEAAQTPNLDALAAESICGLHVPCSPGVTPGSGPGHLGIFGYEPFRHNIGRGVLEALGIDFPLQDGDLAIRVNFCTVDDDGLVADRRAGRIPTELNEKLCQKLRGIELDDVELFIETVKEHRAAIVLRGEDLHGGQNDSDPQETGTPPLEIRASSPEGEKAAKLCNAFVARARELLADEQPANMVLLRGIDRFELLPNFTEVFGPTAAAVATYPMYRGLARLTGMEILTTGETEAEEVETLAEHLDAFDFFFVHIKKTDSFGEDGNFEEKVHKIELVDGLLPRIRGLGLQVIAVTGDHSTPCVLKSHSWHPVPTLLWSEVCRPDDVAAFGERACNHGGLGVFPAVDLVPLMLANAGWLQKYGA